MKRDIEDMEDIELLISSFYGKAGTDEVIGYIFNEVVEMHWEEHIPVICSFWNSVLFAKGGYRGNVIRKHIELNNLENLQTAHFDRWVELWEQTVHENFEGEKAAEAIQRAKTMKELMMYKIKASQDRKFVQ